MRPVLTVEEMRAVDSAALTQVTHAELVARAGRRAAAHARTVLGGRCYGRRIVVVAGRGSNGADGRVAAQWLSRWGGAVRVVEPGLAALPPADLVVDAAFGTGLSRPYRAPDAGGAPVLAVDIPSGITGDTGECLGEPVRADVTVTFGALKPGLLLGDGPAHAGSVCVEPVGLDVGCARIHLVEDADAAALPARPRATHKWRSAVLVVAGQPAVRGAPLLTTAGAMRAGAGYVVLGVPGVDAADLPVGEHVGRTLPPSGWEHEVAEPLERVKAVALGPGLGRTAATAKGVGSVLGRFDGPVVLDADALHDLDLDALAGRGAPTILTPHDGELATLTGSPPGPDRVATVRDLAARCGSIVLLKGPTTVVAAPGGEVHLAVAGSPTLATAGTGDVLTGVIAALCAGGVPPHLAASLGAHVHGRAAALGRPVGLVAGDLPPLVADWLSARPETGKPRPWA